MLSCVFGATLALSATIGLADATVYSTRFNGTTWHDENWVITTTNLVQSRYQTRFSLANGYLGINLAAVGPFFDVDLPVNGDNIQGWPLFDTRQTFATIAGFFDSQPTTEGSNFPWLPIGESVISGVPHWAGLHVRVGDDVLDAKVPAEQISSFSSSLDVRKALLSWRYTWTPSCGTPIKIEYSMFVHKLHVNQAAVRLKMTAAQNINVTVVDVLNGDCAVRSNFLEKEYSSAWPVIVTSVTPYGLDSIKAYIYSTVRGNDCILSTRQRVEEPSVIGGNSSSIAQSYTVTLSAGKKSTVTKYVGGASSDAFEEPQWTALNAMWTAANSGYNKLLASHIAEWKTVMPKESVDDFRNKDGSLPDNPDIQELQITAITNPFQLLQNTVGDNSVIAANHNTRLQVNGVSVGGLVSSAYAGLLFWDMESWISPGLVVSHPAATRQISQYRVHRKRQAEENILTAYQSSQNETGRFSPNGSIYSWTSGRYGNCTGTGPCWDYQYHLNGDIGLQFYNQYAVTGDREYFQKELFPIHQSIAQMYSQLVELNKTTGLYELYNASDPDEYASAVANVGYTLVLIGSHLNTTNSLRERFGMETDETWTNISSLLTVPVNHNASIILEYRTQNASTVVKQADIVLIDDFLQFPNPYTLSNLNYYANAQSPDGPAMTYGVFSIVANRESPSGCSSYTYDLYGSQPYIRGPWFQFSEQLIDDVSINGGTHPAFPFLTGVGGAHRVAVFGYLGLRLNLDALIIDPSLPPQIPQLEFRTIYWQGWPIKAKSNQTHTILTRLAKPLAEANMTFAHTAIPVNISLTRATTFSLEPRSSITIPNRQIGLKKTWPGNIAQCLPVSSEQDHVPGQFPLSAVDGAVSTKWQPRQANITSSLTVSLPGPFVPITEIRFDWAQSPPTSYRVTFHNSTDPSAARVEVSSSDAIALSTPYDAETADIIKPYMSNSTNVTLQTPVWSARFATLEIAGNQANIGTRNEGNGTGASVAEWGLIAEGEQIMERDSVSVWEG